MIEEQIQDRVRAVVLSEAPIKDRMLDGSQTVHLIADLGFDSLGLLELITRLEVEFGLEDVGAERAAAVETLGEAETLVLEMLKERVA
jgi:acyl carrier protein